MGEQPHVELHRQAGMGIGISTGLHIGGDWIWRETFELPCGRDLSERFAAVDETKRQPTDKSARRGKRKRVEKNRHARSVSNASLAPVGLIPGIIVTAVEHAKLKRFCIVKVDTHDEWFVPAFAKF